MLRKENKKIQTIDFFNLDHINYSLQVKRGD